MPSYVVVGASRGIGHAFIQNFAADPSNTVIGLARTPSKVTPVPNAHFLPADMTSFESLKAAASEVGKLTSNKLDYLFINGAYLAADQTDNFYTDFTTPEKPYSELQHDFNMQMNTNVFGVINSVNAFLPLIQAGAVKKVIFISSGIADSDLTRDYDIWENGTYAIAKSAANTVIAKYSARYGKALPADEQILFLAICPGVVATGDEKVPTESAMPGKFMKYAPNWKGPITPEESVKAMIKVIGESSVAKGDGGRFVSHTGTNRWL